MDRIGGPLKDLLARLRLSEPMLGWQAVELWPEVVGERVAARASARVLPRRHVAGGGGQRHLDERTDYLKRRVIEELNRRFGRRGRARHSFAAGHGVLAKTARTVPENEASMTQEPVPGSHLRRRIHQGPQGTGRGAQAPQHVHREHRPSRVSTTWSTRWWTTPSTRPWRGFATASRSSSTRTPRSRSPTTAAASRWRCTRRKAARPWRW